jgi:monoamine oxidase/glycine/D-amino acid oxidase-like deaminating enzyme
MKPILDTLEKEGWTSVRNRWDSYSVDSYLNMMNLSQGALDYMSAYIGYETISHLSILARIRAFLVFSSGATFYRIEDGNDRLIQAMISECETIESNRCSIQYSTRITQIQLNNSTQVQWTTQNGTTDTFDKIVVATTASAALLIDFIQRTDFIEKYRAFRQVHYACSTKILLFFNVSWWYTQENFNGGHSITDLNIHQVYYPYSANNLTDGGTILGSYTFGYSSHLWQSLSESDAIEEALKEVIQLHRSSSNIRDYFQGGKVQNWCGDPYAHGAFVMLSPFQETRLFNKLQAPVSNVHFIGEYTTMVHGWVEGALISALRGALEITAEGEKIFDVIIVGGNPVGLITAVLLSLKQPTLRIAIVDKGIINNTNNSLPGTFDQKQFRQIYSKDYLTELANMSVPLWRQLEQLASMPFGSILNTSDGFLFFGDLNSSRWTVDGDLASIKRTCENLKMGCEYLNSTQIQIRYPIFTLPINYQGIFHNQSGYVNITMLMIGLLRIIDQNANIIIREQEQLLSFRLFDNQSQIITDRGILTASRKVLILPGSYIKNVSKLFNLNLNVKLWELPLYYFRRLPIATRLPTWIEFDNHDQQSLFAGFSIADSTSDYIVIEPNFIQNLSNSLVYPWQQTNIIDPFITQKVIEWVSSHMRTMINASDYYSNNQTYLSTFIPGSEFLLDYIPQTNKRMIIQVAPMATSLVPIWADILSDMTLFEINSSSKYAKYINYFSLPQPNRPANGSVMSNKGYRLTYSFSVLCGFVSLVHYFSISI